MRNLLLFILITTSLIVNAQEYQDENIIPKERPAEYEYFSSPDSAGIRTVLQTAVSSNKNSKIQSNNIKLPYPVIFIHGLNSNAETWIPMTTFINNTYDLNNGGRFDYCLNFDGSNLTTNTNFYPTVGADLAVFTGTWIAGDYYYINFDVGVDGSYEPTTEVLSNQSAIVKQGKAVKDAIQRVLLLTGRDKVVIVGHSMGGLAAREYLQNSANWQSDGQHHVAKLITTGTPHGGSNATSFGAISGGTEGQSEAIRDLRRTYYYTDDNPGVYLFGGPENLVYMEDQLCCYFYTADVNCNGTIGETIIGLNEKNIPSTLDYACIIGECSGCIGTLNPGDGVVWNICADLNNYYTNITNNVFYYYGSAVTEIHTDLPGQIIQNMQGMDEPGQYALAYTVDFDTDYLGFTTVQASGSASYPTDYDLYKFTVPVASNVSVFVDDVVLANLSANIIDESFNLVGTTHNVLSNSIIFSEELAAGDYYLNVFGTEITSTDYNPYTFSLTKAAVTNTSSSIVLDNISIYPNPTNDLLTIDLKAKGEVTVELYDLSGKFVFNQKVSERMSMDVSSLKEGIYSLSLKTNDDIVNRKLMIVR